MVIYLQKKVVLRFFYLRTIHIEELGQYVVLPMWMIEKSTLFLEKIEKKLVLQVTLVKSLSADLVGINIFDESGEKKESMKFTNKYAYKSFSVARSKKYFGFFDGKYVRIYDSSLKEIRRYPAKTKSEAEPKLVLSYDANGYLLVGKNNMNTDTIDGRMDTESLCSNVVGKEVYFNSFENVEDSYVPVSQSGESCVIYNSLSEEFSIQVDAKVLGVYAQDESLYLVTSASLSVFDLTSKLLNQNLR